MSNPIRVPELQLDRPLSIAVISPDRRRRILATNTFEQCGHVQMREFLDYPPSLEDAAQMLERSFDAVLIDLDANTSFALELVETLCAGRSMVVMVFSERADQDLMLQSMRAGAREFFAIPFAPSSVSRALVWVSNRRQELSSFKKAAGRMFVFFGSKGGVGVTTLAANFALALAEQSNNRTLLIDLNLQLGDAAISLGISATHSVVDALNDSSTFESAPLSKFLSHHPSGLSVLAAPSTFHQANAMSSSIRSLLEAARERFDCIVIDAGKKVDLKQLHLFEESATTYLVTQVGIPELRNANRLIAQFTGASCPKLEIVVNRHQAQFLGLTDEHLAKALTQPIRWKVPNDFLAVQLMQKSGTPVIHQNSPIARVIRQMASVASGAPGGSQPEAGFSSHGARLPWKNLSLRFKQQSNGADAIPSLQS